MRSLKSTCSWNLVWASLVVLPNILMTILRSNEFICSVGVFHRLANINKSCDQLGMLPHIGKFNIWVVVFSPNFNVILMHCVLPWVRILLWIVKSWCIWAYLLFILCLSWVFLASRTKGCWSSEDVGNHLNPSIA